MRFLIARRISHARIRFMRNREGIAAVEFALVLPLMLALYFGVTEVSQVVRANQKVEQIAHILADVTARKLKGGDTPNQAAIYNGDITTLIMAAQLIMSPLKKEYLRLEIDELEVANSARNPNRPRVRWAVWHNTTARRPCGDLNNSSNPQNEFNSMPATMASTQNRSGYLVSARVQYDYGAAALPKMFAKAVSLVAWNYAVPRAAPDNPTDNPLLLKATRASTSLTYPFNWEVCSITP